MKASRYNFLVPHTEVAGKYVLFNALSKALFVLDADEKVKIDHLLAHPDESTGDEELRQTLVESQLLIENECNELNLVRYRYQKRIHDNTFLGLTMIPTFLCNFNCYYCYQNHCREQYQQDPSMLDMTKLQMSKEVQERVYQYLERKIKSGVCRVLIRWFGGEPTMALDDVVEMTSRMAGICKKYGVRLDCEMTTNGYLLNVEQLRPVLPYFTQIEVTIDGPASTHDSRRTYRGGSSYDRIVDNIKELQTVSPNTLVSVRINLERNIGDAIPEMLEDFQAKGLKNLHLNLKTLYVDIEKYPDDYKNIYSKEEFAELIPPILRKAIELGVIRSYAPHLGFMRCLVSCKNVFVVMPDGKLHKCYAGLNLDEGVMGELGEHGEENLNCKVVEWYTYDPTAREECAECQYLPLCMGGCCYNEIVQRWRTDRLERSDTGCNILRYNFPELLSLHALLKERGLAQK